jgi:acyl-CoA synthetase (AMP-forming)/AMP-acid ligase II
VAAEALTYSLLSGPPAPADVLPLEDVVRPFTAGSRGIALIADGDRLELSYRELAERAAGAAVVLQRHGVTAGSLVAMNVTNDLPSILAVLGTWIAGGTVVSLPPAPRGDQGWYSRQFRPVLEAMDCVHVAADEDLASRFAGFCRIRKSALAAYERRPGRAPEVQVPDTALVQFTSGSVGTPKGVAIGRRALAGHVAAIIAAAEYREGADRIASWLPLYHDMGLVAMFLTALAARVDQVLARPDSIATHPASWLTTLSAERATATAAPNFAFRLAAAVPYPPGLDLSPMRICISGGERADWQTLCDFHAAAAPMGLDWGALTPSYGMAEGVVGLTYSPVGRGPLHGPGGHVSVGVPFRGVDVRAVAGLTPQPIQVRGDWLFSGYHTAAGFEPVLAGEWFDTGDAGFASGGELYVLGRRNEVLTAAGRNIFAEDVESVAHDACGQRVQVCAAFRNPVVDGRFGLIAEANPRLVHGADAAAEMARLIQTSVSDTLGTRPTPVLITRLGTIPRTTSGKVQRAGCRSLYQDGAITRRLIAELT